MLEMIKTELQIAGITLLTLFSIVFANYAAFKLAVLWLTRGQDPLILSV